MPRRRQSTHETPARQETCTLTRRELAKLYTGQFVPDLIMDEVRGGHLTVQAMWLWMNLKALGRDGKCPSPTNDELSDLTNCGVRRTIQNLIKELRDKRLIEVEITHHGRIIHLCGGDDCGA